MPAEKVEAYRTFMNHVNTLQVNVPFVETILQTPKYFNLLKGLFAARKDLAEVAEVLMSELPKKKGDPGNIVLPCQFGNKVFTRALADSGASINMMPLSFYKKLNLPEPKPVNMKIHLADKTAIHPKGVCEDLLIKVDKVGDEAVTFKAIPEIKQEEEKIDEVSMIQLDDEILEQELARLMKEDPSKHHVQKGTNFNWILPAD
ncbi:uncharacterized protein LOC128133724 [Lactuca sativa]|uniref:uncharacterized protein LOC128133724 n=1 Tax=Lactuca sativa TaxID=4236 RepID=UPI0022B01FD4|nr:uncharacterized protein LOC128133724 [Lactuca sativa]